MLRCPIMQMFPYKRMLSSVTTRVLKSGSLMWMLYSSGLTRGVFCCILHSRNTTNTGITSLNRVRAHQSAGVAEVRGGMRAFKDAICPLSKVTSKTLNLWSPELRTWHFHSEISLLLYLQFYKYIWVSKHQTIHKSKLSRFSTFASMFVCKIRNSITKFSYFIPKCKYL